MTNWNSRDARTLTARQEVQVVIRRQDGTLRPPRTIWIVGHGDRVFIRSTNGPTAHWYRGAVATGHGRMIVGGESYEVTFAEVSDDDLGLVDGAYRQKYGRYGSIVDHLIEKGPRSATLEVRSA